MATQSRHRFDACDISNSSFASEKHGHKLIPYKECCSTNTCDRCYLSPLCWLHALHLGGTFATVTPVRSGSIPGSSIQGFDNYSYLTPEITLQNYKIPLFGTVHTIPHFGIW